MGYPNSTKPAQAQESDIANEGGTAPGGTTAFMSAKGDPKGLNPIVAAHMMHYSAADGAPDGRGNVPIHPGLAPGLFRTARNNAAPDGQVKTQNDATASTGPVAPSGKFRGQSPEVITQNRGSYRP